MIRGLAWIERTLYRNAARIITLWPHLPPYIAARGGHPDRIEWIPNGVALEDIRAATGRAPPMDHSRSCISAPTVWRTRSTRSWTPPPSCTGRATLTRFGFAP